MALKPDRRRTRTVSHIPHDAMRANQRVKQFPDLREAAVAREAAVEQARRAARRLNGGWHHTARWATMLGPAVRAG
jgi:hypothetical protein